MTQTTLSSPGKTDQTGSLKKWLAVFCIFIFTTAFLAWGIRWVTRGNTLGIDFYIYYTAGRGAFIEGLSPYDPQLVRETQMGIYGHLVPPDKDQMAFVYPAYTLFAVYPILGFDFQTAQAIWMAFNLLLIILVWFLLAPQAPPWMSLSMVLFYPITFALVLGNFNVSVGVGLIVFICLFVLRKTTSIPLQILTGMLLAWAMVKPQLTWLFLVLALLIILRDRLWVMLISIIASCTILVVSSFVVFPVDWPLQWLAKARSYTAYVQAESVINSFFKVLFPGQVALILTSLAILILGAITILLFLNWWIQNKNSGLHSAIQGKPIQKILTVQVKDHQLLAWIGFFTYLVHPSHVSYEQIAVMIPFFIWIMVNRGVERKLSQFIWLSGLVVSWLAVTIDLLKWSPVSIYAIPVLFYTIWMILVFKPNLAMPGNRLRHAAT